MQALVSSAMSSRRAKPSSSSGSSDAGSGSGDATAGSSVQPPPPAAAAALGNGVAAVPAGAAPVAAGVPSTSAATNNADQLLAALAAEAASPDVVIDPRYASLRQLLAAAPADGYARSNFARSLLTGVEQAPLGDKSVFGMAGRLLERALASGGQLAQPEERARAAAQPSPAVAAAAAPPAAAAPRAAAPSARGPALRRDAAAPVASSFVVPDAAEHAVVTEAPAAPAAPAPAAPPVPTLPAAAPAAMPAALAGAPAAVAAAVAPALRSTAPLAQDSSNRFNNRYEELLEALAAEASAPDLAADPRFIGVRSLLAAAPRGGEPRLNFARSLLRGIEDADASDSLYGPAATLLDRVLGAGGLMTPTEPAAAPASRNGTTPSQPASAPSSQPPPEAVAMQAPARRTAVPAQQPGSVGTPSRHEQLLASLSAAAAAPQVVADRRYAPLRQLLAAAPAGGEARAAFARNLVRGIEEAEAGDPVFGPAATLLERLLDVGALSPPKGPPRTSSHASAQPPSLAPGAASAAQAAAPDGVQPDSSVAAAAQAQQPASGAASGASGAVSSAATPATSSLETLLADVTAAAAAPEAAASARYAPLRQLLAAAPAGGEPRLKFARSLLRGIEAADERDVVFGPAAELLEKAIEKGSLKPAAAAATAPARGPAVQQAPAAGTPSLEEKLLLGLSAAATAPEVAANARYAPLRQLLAAAPAAGEPRLKFARSLLRGIEAAEEGDVVFGPAAELLERAPERGSVPSAPQSSAAASTINTAAASLPSAPAEKPAAARQVPAVQVPAAKELPAAEEPAAAAEELPAAEEASQAAAGNGAAVAAEASEAATAGAAPAALASADAEAVHAVQPTAAADPAAAAEPAKPAAPAAPTKPAAAPSTPLDARYEQLLVALLAAVKAPAAQQNEGYAALRALLAEAPKRGPARLEFARSLARGIEEAPEEDAGAHGAAWALLQGSLCGDGAVLPTVARPKTN
ncbi:hypothetical protein C2E20_0633 [Micractinium conductrix]|uniref:Uncharacterized protein n=1 Tax=Micractinium conductrix TaxID=554055 RepID=A0A2P6VR34_9CHLO|nr:hypothetical protein C2E20_0633 [Micractinium conductrix]|eukprot:PSC76531.1 hypothetical protein C2E20_0633 [Micractinium conductrix]